MSHDVPPPPPPSLAKEILSRLRSLHPGALERCDRHGTCMRIDQRKVFLVCAQTTTMKKLPRIALNRGGIEFHITPTTVAAFQGDVNGLRILILLACGQL